MQSIAFCGRLLSRVLANGIFNASGQNNSTQNATRANAVSSSAEISEQRNHSLRFLTAVSGFPKSQKLEVIHPGKFGDDAYFIAKHGVTEVIGIADGVGGWRAWGIDPGEFSLCLMRVCERLVIRGSFCPAEPARMLARAYYELLEDKQTITGSSTACVVILNNRAGRLFSANIGDSGFLVVRNGAVVHRSQEQQHYFNTPFQLSLPPPGVSAHVLSDRPESAEQREFPVEQGDVLLLATDGIFDNLPDSLIVGELQKVAGTRDAMTLQEAADALARKARTLAFDENYMSPFALNARKNGIDARGGKPDDITVILASVVDEDI